MSTSTVRVCGRLRDSELPVSHLFSSSHNRKKKKLKSIFFLICKMMGACLLGALINSDSLG